MAVILYSLLSRLKGWELINGNDRVITQRKFHRCFSDFFINQYWLCYFNDASCLFDAIRITCNTREWRFFIDSSSRSVKAVLLYYGNTHPFIPLLHSMHLKEEHDNDKSLIQTWKLVEYGWQIIGDFKIVAFLMGLQKGLLSLALRQ